jgi:L-asparagine oxygenase
MGSQVQEIKKSILKLNINGEIDTIIFDPLYTLYQSDQDKEALDALQQNIIDHAQELTLTEGDLLIFNNHITVHSRSYLSGRFDGTDRWLQRICTY